ncbi:hypothetical protein [Streptomyces phaeochromogenes]
MAAVILGALHYFEPAQDFRFEWQWTSVAAGDWIMFGGPVIAGVTAWEAWLTRRRLHAFTPGHPSRTMSRGIIAVWAGAATWWMAAHGLIVIGYLTAAAASDAIGDVEPTVLAVQFTAVTGYCALGALLGWWIRSPVAAPALGLSLLYLTVGDVPGLSEELDPQGVLWFGAASSLVGWHVSIAAFALQAAAFAGAIVAVCATARRSAAMRRSVVAAGIVMSVLSAILAMSPDRSRWERDTGNAVCVGPKQQITVCGVAHIQPLLADVAQQLIPLVADLRKLGATPPTKYLIVGGEDTTANPRNGYVPLAALIGRSSIPPNILIRSATIPFGCSSAGRDPSMAVLSFRAALYGWALEELGQEDPGRYPQGLVNEIRSADRAAQAKWFPTAYRTAWMCAETGLSYPAGVTPPSEESS